MLICKSNLCTGCGACVSICPQKCISLRENKFGELHPLVDENSCINCQLCVKTCPNNLELSFNNPQKCYASWMYDNNKRSRCASGGIGTLVSEYVISNLNGVVFGSRYDDLLNPVMSYTENLEDLEFFKGSRYVQSVLDPSILKKLKDFLKQGRWVVFIGTPCQVAGVNSFLKRKYSTFLTVDLICHGVSPTKYFLDEINYIKKSKRIKDNVKDVRFRGNDRNNFVLSLWNDHNQCVYRKSSSLQYYFLGFLLGVSLRENCYHCRYARPERISDITIGDFIGLGQEEPFDFCVDNVSSVMINTDQGYSFYRHLEQYNSSHLMSIERNYSERLRYAPSLREPFKRHKLNRKFCSLYEKNGFVVSIRSTLRMIVFKEYMRDIFRKLLHFYKLPSKIHSYYKNKYV